MPTIPVFVSIVHSAGFEIVIVVCIEVNPHWIKIWIGSNFKMVWINLYWVAHIFLHPMDNLRRTDPTDFYKNILHSYPSTVNWVQRSPVWMDHYTESSGLHHGDAVLGGGDGDVYVPD